jgi:hypothetical protein
MVINKKVLVVVMMMVIVAMSIAQVVRYVREIDHVFVSCKHYYYFVVIIIFSLINLFRCITTGHGNYQ